MEKDPTVFPLINGHCNALLPSNLKIPHPSLSGLVEKLDVAM